MGYTSYDLTKMQEKENDFKKIVSNTDNIDYKFKDIYKMIDYNIKIRDNIKGNIVNLTKDLENLTEYAYNIRQTFNNAILDYSESEDKINDLLSGLMDDSTNSNSSQRADSNDVDNYTIISASSVIFNWMQEIYNSIISGNAITHLQDFFEGHGINLNNINYEDWQTKDINNKLNSNSQYPKTNTFYYATSGIDGIQNYFKDSGLNIDVTGRFDRATYQASHMVGMDQLMQQGLIQQIGYQTAEFAYEQYSNNKSSEKDEEKGFWDSVTDVWDSATGLVSNAWDATTGFVSNAWDTVQNADYAQVGEGILQFVGGVAEAGAGFTYATGATVGSGGLLAPVAIGGGGYLFLDGASNAADGFGKVVNGFMNTDPDSDNAIDLNFMRMGYKYLLGEETGENIYNLSQVAITVASLKGGFVSQSAVKGYTNPRLAYQLGNKTAGPLKVKLSKTQAIIGRFNRSGKPIKNVAVNYKGLGKLSWNTGLNIYNVSGCAADLGNEINESLNEKTDKKGKDEIDKDKKEEDKRDKDK